MNLLLQKIVALNPEGWEPADLQEHEGGRVVFQRFSSELISILTAEIPQISFVCLLMAGFENDLLWPMAVWPDEARRDLRAISRVEGHTLHEESGPHEFIISPRETTHPVRCESANGSPHSIVVKLVRHNEFLGLIWIDAANSQDLTLIREHVASVLPAISLTVAEANFSLRLQRLTAPLEWPAGDLMTRGDVYNSIARQAALGLGADGAVLRVYDNVSQSLEVRGTYGQPGVDCDHDVPIREHVCRLVFDSDETFGTAQNIPTSTGMGVEIAQELKDQLLSEGVLSFIILPLQSDIASASRENRRLGTLAVIHKHPHRFSIRDLRIAQMFVERVADDLALLEQKEILESQKLALEEQALMLEMQHSMITRAEIIALLAHDLGHKAIRVTESVVTFAEASKKALRERRTPDFVDAHSLELLLACRAIEGEIRQIRRVSYQVEEQDSLFDVTEVIDEIRSTMKTVLDRLSMEVDIQPKGKSGLLVLGPRGIFGQAIFNLLINAVDAQRLAAKQRRNVVRIHCRRENQRPSRIVIQFFDDGPGISYSHFPKLSDIFEIGKSSKPQGQGTGTGLPVSRSLLEKYFRADLEIKGRRPPLFQISIPVTDE